MRADVAEVGVQEGLNARVDGGQTAAEKLLLLVKTAKERAGGLEEFEIGGVVAEGLSEGGELRLM